jgi:dihydrofolate reductase
MPVINLIAAVADNGVIGAGNALPWRIPEDLKRFKALTMGHTLVMGRKTFDSIGRALPGRTTIVVTRDRAWKKDGVIVAHDLDEALARASGEVFIAGGGEIYAQTMMRAERLYITHVHRDIDGEGDTYFPPIDLARWEPIAREPHDGFEFVDYRLR